MRNGLTWSLASAFFLVASTGAAEEAKADNHFLPEWVSVGVGFMGQAGANFLDKPGDQTVNGQSVTADYPGFVGLKTAYGPSLDVRFLGYVGLEFDVLFSNDYGEADLDFRRTQGGTTEEFDYTIEIGQSAVHLPLLLKGSVPGDIVQPNLFVGPEFVVPGDAECFCGGDQPIVSGEKPSGTASYDAVSEGYTLVTFGLGIELMLPIPLVDIRIPFSLRGSVNPSVSDKRDERSSPTATGDQLQTETFKTNWKFAAVAHFGASWHF